MQGGDVSPTFGSRQLPAGIVAYVQDGARFTVEVARYSVKGVVVNDTTFTGATATSVTTDGIAGTQTLGLRQTAAFQETEYGTNTVT